MAVDRGVTAARAAGGSGTGRIGRRAAAWLAAAAAALWSCAPDGDEMAKAPAPERLKIVVEFFVPGGDAEAEEYGEAVRETAHRILSRFGPEIRASATVFDTLPLIALEVDGAATARLLRMPEVLSIQPDREVAIPEPPWGEAEP